MSTLCSLAFSIPPEQVADWFATLGLSTDYSLQLGREGIDGALLFAARKNLTFLHMVCTWSTPHLGFELLLDSAHWTASPYACIP